MHEKPLHKNPTEIIGGVNPFSFDFLPTDQGNHPLISAKDKPGTQRDAPPPTGPGQPPQKPVPFVIEKNNSFTLVYGRSAYHVDETIRSRKSRRRGDA